jgi:hypothetical protein
MYIHRVNKIVVKLVFTILNSSNLVIHVTVMKLAIRMQHDTIGLLTLYCKILARVWTVWGPSLRGLQQSKRAIIKIIAGNNKNITFTDRSVVIHNKEENILRYILE